MAASVRSVEVMNTGIRPTITSSVGPGWRGHPWGAGRLREVGAGLVVATAIAAVVGFAPATWPELVVAALGLALGLALFASERAAAVLLGLSIPELQDVTGGHLGGLHIAASDVVLVLLLVRILTDAVAGNRAPALRTLRPLRLPVGQYGWLIAALFVFHFGLSSGLKSAQRVELFAVPLLVGAHVALRGHWKQVLRGYVVATTLLAVAWPLLNSDGLSQFQKNPTGQLIVDAILLLVAVRDLRPFLPCLPFLVVGAALTASRGALLGLAVGLLVVSVAYTGRNRRVLVARTLVIVLTALLAYQWLPGDVTSRLTNFTGGGIAAGGYAIDIRYAYEQDAEHLIAEHPWTGVGVGNYLAGTPALGTSTTDPHDVILLEAAEGGYLFAVSFVLLVLGAALVTWRRRRVDLAPAAVGVFLATAAHGLVDVYWVRGTPVLGWLLVGMVCGLATGQEKQPAR